MYHNAYSSTYMHPMQQHDYDYHHALVHYDPNVARQHQYHSAHTHLPAITQHEHSHHKHNNHHHHHNRRHHSHHRHGSHHSHTHSHGSHCNCHHDDEDDVTRPNSKERVSIEINVNDHRNKNKNKGQAGDDENARQKFSVTPRQTNYGGNFEKKNASNTYQASSRAPQPAPTASTSAMQLHQQQQQQSPKQSDLYRRWDVGTVIKHSPKPIVNPSDEPKKMMRAKHRSKHICSLCPHNEYELEYGVPFHHEDEEGPSPTLKKESSILRTKKVGEKTKVELLTTRRKGTNGTPAASEITKTNEEKLMEKRPPPAEAQPQSVMFQPETQLALVPVGYQFTEPVVFETIQPIDQQYAFLPAQDIQYVPQELPRIVELPVDENRNEQNTPVNTIAVFHPPIQPKIREFTYIPSKSPSLVLNSPTSIQNEVTKKEKSDLRRKQAPAVHHYMDEVKN